MGFGLPAAIGAKVAAPHKTVVDVDGDASFSMTAMELATASQYNIGVKVLVLNNDFQGMVLQWQGRCLTSTLTRSGPLTRFLDLFYNARHSHTQMVNPDFILLARSMGVHAIRCNNADELPEKMKAFLEFDESRPVLMECLVERNEHVFPMVRILFTSKRPWCSCPPNCSGCSWKISPRVHRSPKVKTKGISGWVPSLNPPTKKGKFIRGCFPAHRFHTDIM